MAKVQSAQVNTVQPQNNSTARAPQHVTTNFSDLLQQSRILASRLTVHKASFHASSLSQSLPSNAKDLDVNAEPATPERQSIPEIGDSIATLMGRLSLLRARQGK